ncbi:exo-1,3-beta-glucanase [Monosporozyma unispora]|nr:exo-1,3-beta-glucanase [Kazachstania unispora]
MVTLQQVLLACLFWLTSLVIANPIPLKDPNDLQVMYSHNEKRYFNYDAGSMGTPIRGVNIGGWLVLEPYITPSLFEAFRTNDNNDDGIPVDEYHYCQQLGYDEAKNRLMDHWSNWYTESDFEQIAQDGFNLVRIPIGYWAFQLMDNDPYVSGPQVDFLDQAIGWASNYGLKVWVDLHGAVGSQNGFDNSGLRDTIEFLNDENLQVTSQVLNTILEKYSQDQYKDTVIGIELVNEPLGPSIDMDKLKNDFLAPAYDYIRNHLNNDQVIIIHDAFQQYNYWDDFLTPAEENWGVCIDHHHYQVFSPDQLSADFNSKIQTACQWGVGVLSEAHWSVAGEFSAALTDCAKWVNGVGVGSRYDGSFNKNDQTSYYIGSCQGNEDISTWSDERKEQTRRFVEAQLDAFEMRGGWIIWCYKTETSLEWGVDKLIGNGLFPQPITDRQYPGQCAS